MTIRSDRPVSFARRTGTDAAAEAHPAKRLRRRLMVDVTRRMAPAVLSIMGVGAASLVPTSAQAAIPVLAVGDDVYNYVTNTTETVTQIVAPASVITDAGYVILLAQTVGDTFVLSDGSTNVTFEVTAVTTADIPKVRFSTST